MKMNRDQLQRRRQQVQERVRALLADRFQLIVRRESKEMPVYALVTAKNGPKLKEGAGAGSGQTLRGGRGHMIAENVSMQLLVTNLTGLSGRPVIDRTGLTKSYDFTLDYAVEGGGGKGPAGDGGKPEAAAAADPGPLFSPRSRSSLDSNSSLPRRPWKYLRSSAPKSRQPTDSRAANAKNGTNSRRREKG